MSEPIDTKAAARERVAAALRYIEDAQNRLESACQQLSAVTGGASVDWNRVSKLTDKVKAEWYRVESRLQKNGKRYDLDYANKEALERRAVS
jgi:hypothetical protein